MTAERELIYRDFLKGLNLILSAFWRAFNVKPPEGVTVHIPEQVTVRERGHEPPV